MSDVRWVPLLLALAGALGSCQAERLPLDATSHKAAVRKIEKMLYGERPTRPGDAQAVRQSVSDLARELGDAAASGGRGEAVRQLRTFEDELSARTLDGSFDLVLARHEWEDLRGRLFVQQDWFSSSTPEIDQAQGVVAEEEPVPLTTDGIEADEAIARFEVVLSSAQFECVSMPVERSLDPAERAALQEAWQQWRPEHDERVRALVNPRPVDHELPAGFSYELNEARRSLRALTRSPFPPIRDHCEGSLSGVQARLDRARASLKEMR